MKQQSKDRSINLQAGKDINVTIEIFANIFANLFKESSNDLKIEKWSIVENKKTDFFKNAAREYAKKMEELSDTVRIFGMDKPITLRSIYTRVNVLNKITSRQRVTTEELARFFDGDRRGFGSVVESRSGIEAVNKFRKLIVLGKPGSGKTTFLKYIALLALDGKLPPKRTGASEEPVYLVPVFVGLKDFSESGKRILDFIIERFDICNFPEAEPFIVKGLLKGNFLILLDGLDEVSRANETNVIKQIRDLSDKYSYNQFILSCRIAAYNYWFDRFTDTEIADFEDDQIASFVNNWFRKGSPKAKSFWKSLQENKPVKELATIPLLLTLLCLAYDETMTFPINRAELYKEALDALMKKWDSSRNIQRDELYRHLSLRRKESMFGRIAAETFEKKQYFYHQRKVEKLIFEFLKHLPGEGEKPDSEAVLKAIEAHHGFFVERAKGIYSFSHLTFHEYFVAKYIVDNSTKGTLENLVKFHLFDEKWREVFLLTSEMLDDAEGLFQVMKQRIDALSKNRELSKLLTLIYHDIVRSDTKFLPQGLGALAILFMFLATALDNSEVGLDMDLALQLVRTIDSELAGALALESDLDLARAKSLERALITDLSKDLELAFDLSLGPERYQRRIRDLGLNLKPIFPLSYKQVELLSKYVRANELLATCLQTECYISSDFRQSIIRELLIHPNPKTRNSKTRKEFLDAKDV